MLYNLLKIRSKTEFKSGLLPYKHSKGNKLNQKKALKETSKLQLMVSTFTLRHPAKPFK